VIEVSSRYALAIAILVTVALVPEFVHRGARFLDEDCRDADALLRSIAQDDSLAPLAPEHFADMPKLRLASRRLTLPDAAGHLDFHVVQGFNPSLLYHPTELYFVARKPERRTIEVLEHGGARLPLHRAYYEPQRSRPAVRDVTGYLQVFDAEPVAHGYAAQVRAAPRQLLGGRKPVWLFFVHGEVRPEAVEAAERTLREALGSGWDAYRAACLPRG
jgi:hypothetical protein